VKLTIKEFEEKADELLAIASENKIPTLISYVNKEANGLQFHCNQSNKFVVQMATDILKNQEKLQE
jgi:hypothetical protein